MSGAHLHIGIPSTFTNSPKLDARTRRLSSRDDASFSSVTRSLDPLELRWRKLEAKRDEVLDIRADIIRSRRKAQKCRVRKDAADNVFMSFLRPLLLYNAGANVLATSHARLRELFDHMQNARDKCQDVETALELLEEKLGHAEDQLDYAERELISELRPDAAVTNNGKPQEAKNRRPPSPPPPLLLGIGAERAEDFHPLYKKFISAVGYLQLAEEHHRDLLFRKGSIEREQGHLRLAQDYLPTDDSAFNRQLQAQDLEFLNNFDFQMRETNLKMETLGQEVERLRNMCQERGVFPKHAPLHEAYTYERDLGDDVLLSSDLSDGIKPGALFSSRFAVLLYSPNHLIEEPPITAKAALKRAVSLKDGDPLYPHKAEIFASAAKEFLIENLVQDANEFDKTDFINRWLLQRLRTSTVEVELLYSLFLSSSSLEILDLDRWQQDVLFYWTRDEKARLPPERYVGPVTSEYTQGQPVFTGSSVKSSLQSHTPK
ncbi:hypothetical protein J7T55_001982 [Diaporthe amygdali]|uniref:uncharacterized protein n=1 Tax=Phomopsis amygdali TaxID=1214568 RepID=UPI0022FE1446|nr:uncharacterized protein J7T55_001982 [Diaporthe amygdali]KAJ0117782.1 hypothetical protein J7T55_001982 [Diaporthe amygdali]